MSTHQEEIIKQAYASFNARDIPAVLQHLCSDVLWANGWEGGHVQGHAAVEAYWTRQWKELNPRVEPTGFRRRNDGRLEVIVHQVVKDKEGNLLFDGTVLHVYVFETDCIKRMDIEKV